MFAALALAVDAAVAVDRGRPDTSVVEQFVVWVMFGDAVTLATYSVVHYFDPAAVLP